MKCPLAKESIGERYGRQRPGKGPEMAEPITILLVKKRANTSNRLDGQALLSVEPHFKKARTKHFVR